MNTAQNAEGALFDSEIEHLLTYLDELVRWRPGSQGRYLENGSALRRVRGNANHVVLGRRGSGKTRLLDELKRVAGSDGAAIVFFQAEDFKELTYPDILIQLLRAFLRELKRIVLTRRSIPPAHRANWLAFVRHPISVQRHRRESRRLLKECEELEVRLERMLEESDETTTETTRSRSTSKTDELSAGIANDLIEAAANGRRESSGSEARVVRQKELKRIKVERMLGDFKRLLNEVCEHVGKRLVLAVDDFYFIRRDDQPAVIDYIHRICKDTKAYLKVATIKHRSNMYEQGDVIRGVVTGHEIQQIDLELPLGDYEAIKKFLSSLWEQACSDAGFATKERVFLGVSFDQAVLASGGVPRDFFGVVKTAISLAKERLEGSVNKRRLNEAARKYTEDAKLPELRGDLNRVDDDFVAANGLLLDVTYFCRDLKRKNCFQVDLATLEERPQVRRLLDLLADSRLIHLIADNTTNNKEKGRYAAYLLDVGLYAHPERRAGRAVSEVKFWRRDDVGRLGELNRVQVYPLRQYPDYRRMGVKAAEGVEDLKDLLLINEEDYDAAELPEFDDVTDEEQSGTEAGDAQEVLKQLDLLHSLQDD
jgi:hypothetical protein